MPPRRVQPKSGDRRPSTTCLICDQNLKSRAQLLNHIQEKHPPVDAAARPDAIKVLATCPKCGAKGTLQGLPQHVKAKHPELPEGEFVQIGEGRWEINMGRRLPYAVVHSSDLNPYGHPWRWAVYRAEASSGPSWKFRDSGSRPTPELAKADALGRWTETLGAIGGKMEAPQE